MPKKIGEGSITVDCSRGSHEGGASRFHCGGVVQNGGFNYQTHRFDTNPCVCPCHRQPEEQTGVMPF